MHMHIHIYIYIERERDAYIDCISFITLYDRVCASRPWQQAQRRRPTRAESIVMLGRPDSPQARPVFLQCSAV